MTIDEPFLDVVLNGNQAVVAGALAAQCGFFAGYPITPASDIMEGMAKELPLVGGTFLQAEDETTKQFRLQLSAASGKVINKGMKLLGIEVPERM